MRLPKRIDQLVKEKDVFLDMMRTKLEKSVIRLQASLFEQAIEDIIPRLDVIDGVIQDTANNYRLVSELERVYNTFNKKVINTLLPQISTNVEKIAALNNNLMAITLAANIPERFEKVIIAAKKITDLRMGLQGGKMVRGGFLMSLLKSDPTELKQFMSKAVSGQISMKDFIAGIKEKLTGAEDKIGSMERQFKRYAYDTYQQYDRSYNKSLSDEFGMKYFVYRGGLIKDSRDFCAAHNDKVFSKDEAKEWPEWTPIKSMNKGEFPEGWEVKQKDLYAVPGYMGYPGYDPLVDGGGYNCRHGQQYIPDELAYKYRPELRENKKEI